MADILELIYRFLRKLLTVLRRIYNRYKYFLLPNLFAFTRKKILLGNKSSFNQRTFINGAGKVHIGHNCSFGFKLGGFHRGGSIEFQARYKNSQIILKDNISTNNNVFICAANYIEIGEKTLIGQYVTIFDFEAHGVNPQNRKNIGEIGRVIIGKNVWIGSNVMILKNTVIGDNSIVAAGAVVSGIFAENVIVGGVPAKMIKSL